MNSFRFNLHICVVAICLSFVFISCNDKSNVAPIITLTSNSINDSSKVLAGDFATIEFKIIADNDLTKLSITNSNSETLLTFDSLTKKSTFSYTFKTIAGTETFNIIAVDKVGFTSILTFNFTTKSNITSIITGTLVAQDSNIYKTVTIGSQTWMAENLRTTVYRNGVSIPNVTNDTLWLNQTHGAYCSYNNTTDQTIIKQNGLLYNWFAVSDTSKLCPTGWHVSTKADWDTLATYLTNYGYGYEGSGADIAKTLADVSGWNLSTEAGEIGNNITKNNTSGFSALPAGIRNEFTEFKEQANASYWWTATEFRTGYSYNRNMNSYTDGLNSNMSLKTNGYSVRCVKDSGLTH